MRRFFDQTWFINSRGNRPHLSSFQLSVFLVYQSAFNYSKLWIMVKHQKEKLYQSAREHRSNSKLRAGTVSNAKSRVRSLPFNCCALTLTPFNTPVCTPNGIIFENDAILPYLIKYKKDPVTGKPMSTRDLITLKMDKNIETGEWQCPVLCKPFTDYSKVVAIRQNQVHSNSANSESIEANVYMYEAVEELNFKAKNYVDLVSGCEFSKSKDVIMLLDPNNNDLMELRDINNFKHSKMLRDQNSHANNDNRGKNIRYSLTATRIMEKLATSNLEKKRKQEKELKTKIQDELKNKNGLNNAKRLKILIDDVNPNIKMTTGKCSASLTSTSMEVTNFNTSREATSEEILAARFKVMKKMKKKGYIHMITNLGRLDIELHCDIAPRTTTNFLGLAKAGKYDGSIFHRSIKDFMIQGGKPKNIKKKNDMESLWGKDAFPDEFDDRLTHSGRGILSMANSGPNTNKCQFFITFKSCHHLDRKHSVFGRVIKGHDVLSSMESIPTEKKTDKPLQQIHIVSIDILSNPALEAEESEHMRIEKAIALRESKQQNPKSKNMFRQENEKKRKQVKISDACKNNTNTIDAQQIGKYLPKNKFHIWESQDDVSKHVVDTSEQDKGVISRLPKAPQKTVFGNFSSW